MVINTYSQQREVKGVKRKNVELIILISMLIVSFSMINIATAPVTLATVYIDPSETIANPGDTFTINVNIDAVVDLFSYDVRIEWPNGLLQCLGATEGPFLTVNPTIFLPKIYSDHIVVAATSMGAIPGVSGSGTLFTVNFLVLDAGKCTLDIYQSTLLDSTLTPIDHVAEDGDFSTAAEVNLVKKSAWPEHHHYDVSKDEDVYQSLYAKVKNLGPIDLKVYVEFDIVRDDGKVYIVQSAEIVVLAGQEINMEAKFGPLADLDAGKYYANGSCWYSYTGSYWAQGIKMKSFSFAVVP